jgi:hypothetical protein
MVNNRKMEKNDSEVDITYSFLWDEEPTDEQLLTIMKEVEVRREAEEIKKMIQRTLTELSVANKIS